jgi:high-affinity iron transporter
MLINIVILFIKDLLPIFILLCLISTSIAPNIVSTHRLIITLTMSFIGIFTTFNFLPNMSELFDGVGIEIIQTTELLTTYFCLLYGSSYLVTQKKLSTLQSNLIIIAIVLFNVINASQFIVFLDSYMANSESIRNIIVGLAIGFGICLSFSALLYFSINWLVKKESYYFIYFIWALFLSGYVSQIINLLQQVDIIQSSGALWDSSNIVKDSSEYGHLLHTLFGYEASPSHEFILFYVTSLLICLVYFIIISSLKRQRIIDGTEEKSHVL